MFAACCYQALKHRDGRGTHKTSFPAATQRCRAQASYQLPTTKPAKPTKQSNSGQLAMSRGSATAAFRRLWSLAGDPSRRDTLVYGVRSRLYWNRTIAMYLSYTLSTYLGANGPGGSSTMWPGRRQKGTYISAPLSTVGVLDVPNHPHTVDAHLAYMVLYVYPNRHHQHHTTQHNTTQHNTTQSFPAFDCAPCMVVRMDTDVWFTHQALFPYLGLSCERCIPRQVHQTACTWYLILASDGVCCVPVLPLPPTSGVSSLSSKVPGTYGASGPPLAATVTVNSPHRQMSSRRPLFFLSLVALSRFPSVWFNLRFSHDPSETFCPSSPLFPFFPFPS
ncbi:hypothetical protein LZ32DRAFT_320128 [Colletotrichum eremochloae]|nr:hypothetical protein LZ32DRAFT_320128 [Colletotrichum eremochloae]